MYLIFENKIEMSITVNVATEQTVEEKLFTRRFRNKLIAVYESIN